MSTESSSEPLRLRWSRTWPDDESPRRDFVCRTHDDRKVGRLYHSEGGSRDGGEWYWHCYGSYYGRRISEGGRCHDKQAAARLIETTWFESIERMQAVIAAGGFDAYFAKFGMRQIHA